MEQGMGLFKRFLTLSLAVAGGIALGQFAPMVPETLSRFEYAQVSIPVAVLIWAMIFRLLLAHPRRCSSSRPRGRFRRQGPFGTRRSMLRRHSPRDVLVRRGCIRVPSESAFSGSSTLRMDFWWRFAPAARQAV